MSNNFRTLFIIPTVKSMLGSEMSKPGHPHVGIAYLISMLKKNNLDFKIIDMALGYTYKDIFETIEEYVPNLIATTSFSYNSKRAYELIENIKKEGFRQPIVIGGTHVSAITSQVLYETSADFAIVNEGEYSLIELVENLNNSEKDLSRIRGLIWRQDSSIIENEVRPYIENLDELPFPAYDDFGLEKYSYYDNRCLPIITSRGCPYKCNYCSVRLSMGRPFRARSPENVVSEIEYWYSKGWTNFDFNDDVFNLDMYRAERICDLILERKLNIAFHLYNGIRPDRVKHVLLKKMKEAGCIFIAYGCEAVNEMVLQNIKKGFTVDIVRQAVIWTNEVGIKNSVNFIIGHPGETYERALESLQFAKSLPTNFVNFFNLLPYPGTELFEWIKNNKNARFIYKPEDYLGKISYRDPIPVFETDEFTASERIKILKKGFQLYEKTAMQFRLGKFLGYIAYLLTRNRWIFEKATYFFIQNRVGRKIFINVTKKSRKPPLERMAL